jgi:Telomere regulation protein Stn1
VKKKMSITGDDPDEMTQLLAGEGIGGDDLTGVESFLVGIAPCYWAHVPMLIGQVHNLCLVQGVHCLLLPEDSSNYHIIKPIPVSKCKLVGCVVRVERKGGRNGCILYVIDDGTGLMDCLFWADDDDSLPSLTGVSNLHHTTYQIGDMVQVYGKIRCVGMFERSGAISEAQSIRVGNRKTILQVTPCKRELHVSLMKPVCTSRAQPHAINAETQHWKDCVQQQPLLQNSLDILQQLGPVIADQVADRNNIPSTDDSIGAWRLFGASCPCPSNEIKEQLLYCHCIASPQALDSDLRYRDAVLERLLEMEREQQRQDQCTNGKTRHLRFLYRDILDEEVLMDIALQQLIRHGKTHSQLQQLVQGTFQALRKDGIVYLIDVNSDTYLLISKTSVLEPYVLGGQNCKDAASRARFHAKVPSYLEKVPKARMQLVRRSLLLERDAFNESKAV